MAALENDVMMARFRRDYLALLDVRVLAIVEALDAGRDMDAHVALLSLESSSSMIGASALAEVVAELRAVVETGTRTRVPQLVLLMNHEADRIRKRMTSTADSFGRTESR